MLAYILTNYDKDLWIVMWFLFHFNSQYYNYNTVRIWNTTYYHLQLILIKIMSFFKIIKLFSPCVLLWILYFDSVVPIVMILLVLSYGLYTCGLFYLCKWSWSYLCYVDGNMLLQIRLMLLVGRSQILLVVSLSLSELCKQTLAVLFMLMLFHCVVVINGHGSVLLVRFNNMVC